MTQVLRSKILLGKLMHHRLTPQKHYFEYPHYWLALDLAELSTLNQTIKGFSHNKFNLFSIYDKDYLGDEPNSILEKLHFVLRERDYLKAISRVMLVTSPRYLNCVFNPLNLYYCYDNQDKLLAVVAEINNTYADTHVYVLDQASEPSGKFVVQYQHKKEFYVSPYNDLKGHYDFLLTDLNESIEFRLNLIREEKPLILTRFIGETRPFNTKYIWKTVAKYPLLGLMTLIKIWIHAILIRVKGVKPVLKPKPIHPMTYRKKGVSKLQDMFKKGV